MEASQELMGERIDGREVGRDKISRAQKTPYQTKRFEKAEPFKDYRSRKTIRPLVRS